MFLEPQETGRITSDLPTEKGHLQGATTHGPESLENSTEVLKQQTQTPTCPTRKPCAARQVWNGLIIPCLIESLPSTQGESFAHHPGHLGWSLTPALPQPSTSEAVPCTRPLTEVTLNHYLGHLSAYEYVSWLLTSLCLRDLKSRQSQIFNKLKTVLINTQNKQMSRFIRLNNQEPSRMPQGWFKVSEGDGAHGICRRQFRKGLLDHLDAWQSTATHQGNLSPNPLPIHVWEKSSYQHKPAGN